MSNDDSQTMPLTSDNKVGDDPTVRVAADQTAGLAREDGQGA